MADKTYSQIPLTVYKGGVRTELGMVIIGADGTLLGQVKKEHWPVVKELFAVNVGELSIAPFRPRPIIHNSTPSDLHPKIQE